MDSKGNTPLEEYNHKEEELYQSTRTSIEERVLLEYFIRVYDLVLTV